ncbi:MAG: NADP-dependent isocitrate dehydrogenase [Planctomycetota bacterium]
MASDPAQIHYTLTDEAPALATASFLPIVRAFLGSLGHDDGSIEIVIKDISLAGRVLAAFADLLPPEQRREDALSQLGELAKTPNANIIKLPNISASIPQLTSTIQELQNAGFAIPDFPADPQSDAEKATQARYAKVLGSAVNPVLREGNSDRRVAPPVKRYAQANPHSMGAWSASSKTRVAHMSEGDFYGSEASVVMGADDSLKVVHTSDAGVETLLHEGIPVLEGEIVDAAVMSRSTLRQFIADSIEAAKADDVLLSVHLKATMMKVSDPILFGNVVRVFFSDLFDKHVDALEQVGVDPNQGLGQWTNAIESLPTETQAEITSEMQRIQASQPRLAMVDSDRGITNLHVPSDVIIDASMPAAIRAGGKMYGPDGKLDDTLAIIPDRSYAGVYQAVIDDCKANGAYDVTTMGSVSNVGLMAKKAEEYGSHDKTFQIASAGTVTVVNGKGDVFLSHAVQEGDIWRACQTKAVAVEDWVRLGVARARATGSAAVFWLDAQRAHDRHLIARVESLLPAHDLDGLDIQILSPVEATRHACQHARAGQDSIAITGNVLRDYLTDLFPILELGTSAKMLSIVPLLAGGGLFETGAGGSAPKHVQQFVEENHLRWDSLGEFLALGVSLEDLSQKTGSVGIAVLASTLESATTRFLTENKSPSRKTGERDNRGSHYYLAQFWASALAEQAESASLAERFQPIAKALVEGEAAIVDELLAVQGAPVDLGGYYYPDSERVSNAMRPSETFNEILARLVG